MGLKILIISHKRWGKDTLAEILCSEFNMRYAPTSESASDIFIFDLLKDKYKYRDSYECFLDRVNHRAEWNQLIAEYNKPDSARLAKDMLKISDCYVGMRDPEQIQECLKQNLFDLVIWVDASKRLPPEDADSFKIDSSFADIIIDNNTTLDDFRKRVIRLGNVLFNNNKKYV